MNYVLDTSVISGAERGDTQSKKALSDLAQKSRGKLSITSPTYSELCFGYLRKSHHNFEIAIRRIDQFDLLNTNRKSSMIFARLKKEAEESGNPLPIMDLLIASIVMANGATLLTHDRGFEKIKGLEVVVI